MTQYNFSVSVVLLREGERWAAQCLEWDIAAQGKSIPKVMDALEQTFVGQVIVDLRAGKQPLEGIPQAPRFYWNAFKDAPRLEDRRPFYLGENVPPAFMIRAAADDMRIAA